MTKPRSLVESALLTGLSVILYIGADIPLLGALLMFLSPVPMVILEMRHDLRSGAVALLTGALIVALLQGPIAGVSYAFGFSMLGLVLGRIIEMRRSAVEILAWGSLVSLLCKLILAVILFYVTGLNPMNLDMTGMEKIMDWMLKLPSAAQQTEAVKAQIEAAFKVMPLIVPAVFIMVSVIDCSICYWISARVIKRLNHVDLPSLPPFDHWRFPPSVLWAFVLAIICLLIAGRYPQFAFLTRVGLNVQLLVHFIFILQGLSLAEYWMKSKGWPTGGRRLMIAMLFFIPIFSTFVTYAGILDMCWNIRTRFGGDRK